jgi:hypothetical protein
MPIDVLGMSMVIGGGLGMAGVLVSPQLAGQTWLTARTMALSGLLVVTGLGLLMRYNWARRFAAGAMIYAIYAQLSRRWMQSDVVQAWMSCVQGGSLNEPVPPGALPPLSPDGALLSLVVCMVLASMVRLLLSAQSRGEFIALASRPYAAQMPSRDGWH